MRPSPGALRPADPRRRARPRRPRGDPHVHTRGKPLASDVDLAGLARQTAGLTGADLANLCNEAAIFAGRAEQERIRNKDFDDAFERVVAGLQQRKTMTEKEKRVVAYHEAGHALMSHLVGEPQPVQKVTIVSRGLALGYTLHTPQEDRFLSTKEELIDRMKVLLGGRAAEQIVFGAVTNGASNDLERVTAIARAMIFEYGMGDEVSSRTLRADNYALSEETKRLRDDEQARLTDQAYAETVRLIAKHRGTLDRVTAELLEKETLNRQELEALLANVQPESNASERVGTPAPSETLCQWLGSGAWTCSVHHVAFAVEDLDAAVETYRTLFGAEVERAGSRSRASRRSTCAWGRGGSSSLRRSAPTRTSGAFSPAADPACTTSASASRTWRRRRARGQRCGGDRLRASTRARRPPRLLCPSPLAARRSRGGSRCLKTRANPGRLRGWPVGRRERLAGDRGRARGRPGGLGRRLRAPDGRRHVRALAGQGRLRSPPSGRRRSASPRPRSDAGVELERVS